MGADPIAMCGSCREVISFFPVTSCVGCISDRFSVDINDKEDRVLSKDNIIDYKWVPHCHMEKACDQIRKLEKCTLSGHKVLIDPCW